MTLHHRPRVVGERSALRAGRAVLRVFELCAAGVAIFSPSMRAAVPVPRTLPLQARLDVPLDSRRSITGAPVFAAALFAWPGPDCSLAQGGVISGHIVEAKPRRGGGGAEAEITVSFEKADCNGQHDVPVHLLLYAVIEPNDMAGATMHDQAGLFGSTSAHAAVGQGPVASINTADAVRNDVSGGLQRENTPGAIHAGQILGEDHVEMAVGTGVEGSSRIHSSRRDFRISTGATLVLVVPPRAHFEAVPALEARSEPAPRVEPSPPPPPPPLDETEICGANCSDFSVPFAASTPEGGTSHNATVSVALARLGYRPSSHTELTGFDHETSLNFLTDSEILLTFDPHHLRERAGVSWHASTRRVVRAALLDAVTKRVEQVVDWKVDGEGQYLWKVGPSRVLVHMGGGLHVLGPNLQEFAVIPAEGELLWVTISPSGKKIAFGLRQERHRRQEHELIKQLSGLEPEEDVEMRLVDDTGKALLTRNGPSTATPPVLTDDGELVVAGAGLNRWKLIEQLSDGGPARTLVTLNSSCLPWVSAPLQKAMFVVGCEPQGGRWFRVVRKDGHTLLKGKPSLEEVEQTMLAGGDDEFVIRVVTLANAINANGIFRAGELRSEHIEVHRERDGKSMFATTELRFPLSRDNYALSSDGIRLAVITQTELEIYNVTAPQ